MIEPVICICGGTPDIYDPDTGPGYVSCGPNNGCGRFGPDADSREEAIEAWNSDMLALRYFSEVEAAMTAAKDWICRGCCVDNDCNICTKGEIGKKFAEVRNRLTYARLGRRRDGDHS
jgi:hypothetical protein